MALTDDQQKEVYDLLKANDIKITGLEQRLDRLEWAIGSKHEDATGEGFILVRLLHWAQRKDREASQPKT